MNRSGWAIFLAVAALTTGCSSSGRLVAQNGYRGIAAEPPIARAEPRPPGSLALAPEAPAPVVSPARPVPAGGD